MKKIVLKVCIYCQKCKRDLLRVATKLTGIDSIAVDSEKGTLTILGTVDTACLTKNIRKSGKMAEIISVGPPKPPEPPKPPQPCKCCPGPPQPCKCPQTCKCDKPPQLCKCHKPPQPCKCGNPPPPPKCDTKPLPACCNTCQSSANVYFNLPENPPCPIL